MSGCITIYTDASVCSESKVGGWSCWIKSKPGKATTASVAFREKVNCVNDAEMKAIANAIGLAVRNVLDGENLIVVVTDSQTSQQLLSNPRPKKIRREAKHLHDLADYIRTLVPEGCVLKVNKVKAHSKNDGARSYVNNLVDKAARSKMKELRKQKSKEGH